MEIILHIIVILIIFILWVRYYLENKTVFVPSKTIEETPKNIGLECEDVFFKTEDNLQLNGWLIKAKDPLATLLFAHGNAGNISHRLDKIDFFHKRGVNVFIFDYRGYGKSQGSPTEKGMYRDILAAYAYLLGREDIDRKKVIAYGASLGGVAAIDLASQKEVAGLIVDSSFSSAKDMAKVVFPFLPSILIRLKLDSMSKIHKVTAPKLFIHSVNDDVVPFDFGKKLYDAAPNPKKFVVLEGDHNNNFLQEEEKFKESIDHFLKQL